MESKNNLTAAPILSALKAHLAINVRDVEQSIEFYRKLFGIEPSKVRTGYAKFDVQNPPLNFTLNEGVVNSRGALSHLGIQVQSTEDVLATRQRWQDDGLLTRDEMQTSCCYAVQDKTWVRDPDGNEWEVFVVLEDNLAETAACECGDKVVAGLQANAPVEIAATCCATPPVNIGK
ncbi:MAG: ArsI/CadI family heavy metal resistance metalloenzyme [Pyrinomonadaceae bacterium]